jgi:hypothetical protein
MENWNTGILEWTEPLAPVVNFIPAMRAANKPVKLKKMNTKN